MKIGKKQHESFFLKSFDRKDDRNIVLSWLYLFIDKNVTQVVERDSRVKLTDGIVSGKLLSFFRQ